MKRYIIIFIIALFIITLLLSCQTNTVHVAFAGSLTGQYFELGQSSMRGFELAVEEINSIDENFQINTHIFDDESSIDRSLTLVDDIHEKNIEYVIGFNTSNMLKAVEYGMENYKMLFLSPSMSTYHLSEIDDLFVRVSSTVTYEAEKLAQVMIDQSINKLAIVLDMNNYAYTDNYYKSFASVYNQSGGEISLLLGIRDDDISSVSQKILNSQTQGLLLITTSAQASYILQELYANNYKTQIALSMWTFTEELAINAGKAGDGAFGFSSISRREDEKNDFDVRYKEKFHSSPSFGAYKGYEAMMTLYKGLLAGSSTEEVKNSIINQTYQGIQSSFKIDSYGDCEREYFLIEIFDGELINKKILP